MSIGTLVEKASDTTRNSTTTATDDPDLVVNLAANTTYRVHLLLLAVSNTANDIKFRLASTAACVGYMDYRNPQTPVPVTAVNSSTMQLFAQSGASLVTATAYGTLVGDASSPYTDVTTMVAEGLIHTTTSGVLKVQWAQVSSGASDATLKANSILYVEPIP
jgi:hypothetical protein